jgi:hypothetical protein
MIKHAVTLAFVIIAGCKAEKPADSNAPAKAVEKAPFEKRLTADCPAYHGKAKVDLADIDGGYTVAITTEDPSEVKAIREDAAYVAAATAAGAGASALQLGGTMGDRTRNCPVILDGTTITVEEKPGGATLTVRAKDAAGVEQLRKTARDKAELLAAFRDAMKK